MSVVKTEKVGILLIDQQPVFCYGLKSLLEQEPGLQVVGMAHNYEEGVELAATLQPDLILLEIRGSSVQNMDVVNGLRTLVKLREQHETVRIAVLTERSMDLIFNQLIKYKVIGFLTKNSSGSHLIDNLRMVANGQIIFSEELTSNFLDARQHTRLTMKEMEVIKLISEEKTNKGIAATLNHSKSTIEYYVTNILNKLSVRSRVGAVREARRLGLI